MFSLMDKELWNQITMQKMTQAYANLSEWPILCDLLLYFTHHCWCNACWRLESMQQFMIKIKIDICSLFMDVAVFFLLF